MEHNADVIIIGAGPAGMSAAVNASSEGLRTILIDADSRIGGQSRHSAAIENYLGFPLGLTGKQLAFRAARQAVRFGTEIHLRTRVKSLSKDGKVCVTICEDGDCYTSRAVIVASGLAWRRLHAENEDAYLGKGVYYGADKEMAARYHGRTVAVVGAANSAGQAALHFAKFAAKLYVLIRGENLQASMSEYLIERIAATPNIEVLKRSNVTAVSGTGRLQAVTVAGEHSGILPVDCLLVFIGSEPSCGWVRETCEADTKGFLVTDAEYRAKCAGVFVVGDVRSGSTKRIAAAVGEGSAAVSAVHRFLAEGV